MRMWFCCRVTDIGTDTVRGVICARWIDGDDGIIWVGLGTVNSDTDTNSGICDLDNQTHNIKDFTKQLMRLLTPSFLLLGFFVLGGILFKTTTPNRCDTILPDDNIFVLTGDTRRIPYAMRMINKYPDAGLYIIGDGTQPRADISHRVRVESFSKSTYQNALAIRDIVQHTGLNRIVIVTTEDHTNRARYLIKQELPYTEVVACPVPLTDMPAPRRLERWTIEYVKYIVTMLGIKES